MTNQVSEILEGMLTTIENGLQEASDNRLANGFLLRGFLELHCPIYFGNLKEE